MKKVLIIEDEESAIEVLYYNIKRRGYLVEIANCGEDGLEKIINSSPDIVLLDIKLPDMDGWEILQQMNSKGISETKVIIVSAATQKSDLERAEAKKVSLYVTKPFDLQKLMESIARLAQNPADTQKLRP
jgi:CheY-like chemotaxis protein